MSCLEWLRLNGEAHSYLLQDEELVAFNFPGVLPPEFLRVHHTPLELPGHHLQRTRDVTRNWQQRFVNATVYITWLCDRSVDMTARMLHRKKPNSS